ncbi:MAG: hypothetical protein CML76_04155 [Rhodobiaceae bacterium]|nr:hypothetical protein [Rhodobiaceae bacterium]
MLFDGWQLLSKVIDVWVFLGIEGTSIQSPRVKRLFLFEFDGHTLANAAGQGRLTVDNSVFSEKYALPWSTRFDHVRWRPISTIRIGIDSIVGLKH